MKSSPIQSFLLFLKNLLSFSRNRWDQSIRRLWHIFVLLRSHFSPQNPEKRANLRGAVGSPPTNSGSPAPMVICASQLPPTLIPIAGGDAPVVVSLMSDPTQIRQATIPDPETTSDESHENGNTDPLRHVDADGAAALQNQDHRTPNTPPIPSRPTSTVSPIQADHAQRAPIDGVRDGASASFGSLPVPRPRCILRPMLQIDRYEKHNKMTVSLEPATLICPPVTTVFPRDSLPQLWVPFAHPEGALYWVYERGPIYTDTNMCDPSLRSRIEEALEEIEELKRGCPPLPAGDWELALELGEGATDELICSYYFVCHSTRCLFWLHEFDVKDVFAGLRGVTEPSHVHLALEVPYWTHWEMYPHNREIPEQLLQKLLGILVHSGVDSMTSSNSTVWHTQVELKDLLHYTMHIPSIGGNYGFSACVVGRLMGWFTFWRYLNFHGQRGARLTTGQTVYQPKRTYIIKIMSIFLFFTPGEYLRDLESTYAEFVFNSPRLQQFFTQLQNSWKEFVLYGTVLLNANVAFLAIPSVDSGNNDRTQVQLASYFSIITSLGCIATGLLLLRQHKTKREDFPDRVGNYLQCHSNHALGFETLAIVYSLPYSLLLWSTAAFTIAVCLETIAFSHQPSVKLSVGLVFAFVLVILLASWHIRTVVDAENFFSVRSSIRRLKTWFFGFLQDPRSRGGDRGS